MDYKKIFKNPKTRTKILNCFSFIPDKSMLKIQYYIKLGKRLNLKNPKLYTEKIQWYKLNYKNPLLIQCVDKFDVRNYIQSKGFGSNLNTCYGVFDNPNAIDFNNLPNSFVVKDTIGGGSRSVIIVKDKVSFDLEELKKIMNDWILQPHSKRNFGREWPYYSGKKHRIIIEKYIESNQNEGGLIDYKFFCFNGKVKFLYVVADRKMGQNAEIGIFNRDFQKLPYKRADERPLECEISKPKNYKLMLDFAETIAEDFPHVRVDLYNVDGSIIFGETTFYPGSGYMKFSPSDFDRIAGDYFILHNNTLIE